MTPTEPAEEEKWEYFEAPLGPPPLPRQRYLSPDQYQTNKRSNADIARLALKSTGIAIIIIFALIGLAFMAFLIFFVIALNSYGSNK